MRDSSLDLPDAGRTVLERVRFCSLVRQLLPGRAAGRRRSGRPSITGPRFVLQVPRCDQGSETPGVHSIPRPPAGWVRRRAVAYPVLAPSSLLCRATHHNTMGMEDIVTMLGERWVRACFSGHEHNFQHAQHNGVTYFVTGAGSKVRTSVSNKFADAHTRSWAATCTRGRDASNSTGTGVPRRFTPRMTLSSLNPAVYGFLEARVDFDRSRSTC